MLGQAPTVCGDYLDPRILTPRQVSRTDEVLSNWNSDPDPLNVAEQICGERLEDNDFVQMLLKEQLNETEALLMDVPILPPPNEHVTSFRQPRALADLLAVKIAPDMESMQAACTNSPHQYQGPLKKMKGVQPLNLELTWRPFNFGTSIPTHEELTNTTSVINDDVGNSTEHASAEIASQCSILLHSMNLGGPLDELQCSEASMPSLRECKRADDSDAMFACQLTDADPEELILCREERRRIHGHVADEGTDSDSESLCSENFPLLRQPAKRAKLHDSHEPGSNVHDREGLEALLNPGFTKLASNAQGFEGSNVDMDVNPDIDPVHYLDSTPPVRGFPVESLSACAAFGRPHSVIVGNLQQTQLADFTPNAATDAAGINTFLPLSMQSTQSEEIDQVARTLLCSLDDDQLLVEEDSGYCDFPAIPAPQESHDIGLEREVPAIVAPPIQHSATTASCTAIVDQIEPNWTVTARRSLAEFLSLRGRQLIAEPEVIQDAAPLSLSPQLEKPLLDVTCETPTATISEELIDSNTVRLGQPPLLPATLHRYLASLDAIQKRALVRILESPTCAVELVERERLDNVDLILSCDTAIQLVSVATLPSRLEAVASRVSQSSWRFKYFLLLFECYPDSWSYGGNHKNPHEAPNLMSPPVIKSIKSLRRTLAVAEGCGTKNAEGTIHYAFARSVEEAALLIRAYGDLAESADATGGAVWGDRHWLLLDENDGESDIAGVAGMNAFAASIILSQVDLQQFLDAVPETRLQAFGPLIGVERMLQFNEDLAHRTQTVQFPSSPPHPIDGR
ncbi:hypothetical protein CERSUDRAFT_90788 [Gelatoporia subvermispora B]|uniref:Uncharacterized protein n=1 Tax=Ceriporiopsis subvermispora (strain B) TaxID=914234 RepID=M2RCK9_CERS8|nr:hypothetical protein CERSUDRAFT_90788 [Gelatoporia subvermispora B]